ncbi:MAG: hypothetical protein CL902_00940 [Dehalococcoidia bacterium]|mgnify:CR=1 FL=1|nr:hypothetical protein [Dehalococcoidia bacterium]
MIVLSLDIGIVHLAWVLIDSAAGVLGCGLWDIREPCAEPNCTLPHTRETYDRLCHIDAHYVVPLMREAEFLLLERQPPGGLQAVEDFFFGRYRDRAVKVHPCAVHAWSGIRHLDYEARKAAATKSAKKYIPHLDSDGGRVHDIADAVCQACWFFEHRHRRKPAAVPRAAAPLHHVPAHAWMDKFAHIC